jgi:hypothetical protein
MAEMSIRRPFTFLKFKERGNGMRRNRQSVDPTMTAQTGELE